MWPCWLISCASAARSRGNVWNLMTSLFCSSRLAVSSSAPASRPWERPEVSWTPDSPAREIGDGDDLRGRGHQADQVLGTATCRRHRKWRPNRPEPPPAPGRSGCPRTAPESRRSPGGSPGSLLAPPRRSPWRRGRGRSDGDRPDTARAAVDQHGAAGCHPHKVEGTDRGLGRDTRGGGDSPVHRRRLRA